MHDQTTTETQTPATPAKLSGFSTAKTQQNGALVTLARCDWAALHNGDNALPSNPSQIAAWMQGKATEGVSVVAWLQGPAVIINGHDSKSATSALLSVVNAYTAALKGAEAAEAAEAAAAENKPAKSRNGRR
jgi:hypothetical protein